MLLSACNSADDELPAATPSQTEPAADAESAGEAARDALGRGEVVVNVSGGFVTLTSNHAPRARVLTELARVGGFAIDLRSDGERRLTLRVEEALLRDVVALLAQSDGYSLAYGFDAGSQAHRVVRVEIGGASGRLLDDSGLDETERDYVIARQRDRMMRDRLDRTRPDFRLLEDELASPYAEVRAAAIIDLDAAYEDTDRVLGIALDDPSKRVRLAAIQRLEEAEGRDVVSGLIDLLEDEDPDIRAAAIAGLEWQDDSRAIDPLVELLDRPEVAADLELAAMIEDAIVWLEE
jgi:hypothetical protein